MSKLLISASVGRYVKRCLHSIFYKIKVTIIWGAGEMGRHLSMYGKVNNEVGEIVPYDIVDYNDVSRNLMDIDKKPEIKCYKQEEKLLLSLKCSNLVLIVGVQTHSIIADDASVQ
uniref:Uncharacterized protein n=1 Tax=Glossina austeni TaxID=7395 RepID=A0A1A9UM51_GLOAU